MVIEPSGSLTTGRVLFHGAVAWLRFIAYNPEVQRTAAGWVPIR